MSSDEEEVFVEPTVNKLLPVDATYVVPAKTNHPPYYQMTEEAIFTLSKRTAISRTKIVDFIKLKYDIVPIPNFVTRALKKGIEENAFENTTSSGAQGSFKLVKEHREKLNNALKSKNKPSKENKASKSENEDKSKKATKNDDATKSKKPPTGSKNKENKAPKKKETKETTKKKTLKKANSTGTVREKIAKALPPTIDDAVVTQTDVGSGRRRQKKSNDK